MNKLTDEDLNEFMTLWNKLSEMNRLHIKRGLEPTDGMIRTTKQAKLVIVRMKGLLALQMLENKNDNSKSNETDKQTTDNK